MAFMGRRGYEAIVDGAVVPESGVHVAAAECCSSRRPRAMPCALMTSIA